jgi:hypothetical protein
MVSKEVDRDVIHEILNKIFTYSRLLGRLQAE